MGNGARLAIAILILFLAMVAFFFAFHPGGVNDGKINGPVQILQWMFGKFDDTVNGTSASGANAGTTPAAGSAGQTPTLVGPNVAPIANVPGSNTSMVNLVGPNVAPIANLPLWQIYSSKAYQFPHDWKAMPFHQRRDALSRREQKLRHRLAMQRAIAELTGQSVLTTRLPSAAMLRKAAAAAAEMSALSKPNSSEQSYSLSSCYSPTIARVIPTE